MTNDELTERLDELRALDDPRTDPESPYTPEYSHLEDEWPQIAPDGAFYRIFWKEERTDGVEPMEGKTQMLRAARSLAQNRSVHPRTVANLAWVQLAREDEEPEGEEPKGEEPEGEELEGEELEGEEPETVDVWGHGFWTEPHAWTKEGAKPRRPDA
jgi:hypothetical protein